MSVPPVLRMSLIHRRAQGSRFGRSRANAGARCPPGEHRAIDRDPRRIDRQKATLARRPPASLRRSERGDRRMFGDRTTSVPGSSRSTSRVFTCGCVSTRRSSAPSRSQTCAVVVDVQARDDIVRREIVQRRDLDVAHAKERQMRRARAAPTTARASSTSSRPPRCPPCASRIAWHDREEFSSLRAPREARAARARCA